MIIPYKNIQPQIANNVYVAETASIIGHVELEKQANIWFGAVLRGDIEPIKIGERTNIQDNSVIHTSHNYPVIIGNDVTVGHQVTAHGCTIEDGCLIGMKATLLDGSKIGKNSMIGAGSLVKQNQVIPPGSLALGNPARVIRPLTEEEIVKNKHITKSYLIKMNDYC